MNPARFLGLLLIVFGAFAGLLAGVFAVNTLVQGIHGHEWLLALAVIIFVLAVVMIVAGSRLLWKHPLEGRWSRTRIPGVTEEREIDGVKFGVRHQPPRKNRPGGLIVRVKAITFASAEFTRETRFDRFCKRIGIQSEYQSGHAEFDHEVFIHGTDRAFIGRMLDRTATRRAIRTLLANGFTEVKLTGSYALAVWTGFDGNDLDHIALEAAKQLQVIAEGPDDITTTRRRGPEPQALSTAFLYGVLGLFATAILFCYFYPPLHFSEYLLYSVLLAAAVIMPFGWLSAKLLRDVPHAHDHWVRLLIIGGVLIGMGSFGSVAAVNALADRSLPQTRECTVESKRDSTGWGRRRYRHTYYLTVRDPVTKTTSEYRVSSADYFRANPHQSHYVFVTCRGALGIEWVKSKSLK